MQSKNSPIKFPVFVFALIFGCAELLIWLIDEWTGYFINVLMLCLSAAILLISGIVEWLERSRIPDWYFPMLWMLLASSLSVLLFYGLINGFHFDWQSPAH
ncbi:MAG: hypothetical protein K1X68_02760 [Saprospiraceae bacterium]|nr:hypothetical protein [Saprospiraceae bacterium]HMW39156.1 hypothetical protein [Saprospiraceae bacterium]HMX88743.1 hypothetical protein [Saprospiraceae bacterium]HMZ38875.1 hypothetical protein [Saprospiraceae bacterium]HNA64495.1 hypothetical protein [Saprospiraceae bacterium]